MTLTPRQREIVELAADGWSNDEIGRRKGLHPDTVKRHLSMAYESLGAVNRAHAARIITREEYASRRRRRRVQPDQDTLGLVEV